MRTPSSLLPPDLIALIEAGISVIVSSADAALRPSIMRAVGSAITPDGSTVTVYLARRQSRQLLQDLSTSGRIAVVFTQPRSHRTVQVKSSHVRMRPADTRDLPVLQRYLANMEREIQSVGFDVAFTRQMLSFDRDDVVAISFEPTEAFDQTPGPKAGGRIDTSSQGPA